MKSIPPALHCDALEREPLDPSILAGGWIGKGVVRSRAHDAVVLGFANSNWSRHILDGPIG